MPRLGLGSLELSSLGGTGQDVVTTIDDFFFESNASGEVNPMLTTSRTNLLTYSEDFSQWTVDGNASITSNATTSPTGTSNATKLIAGSSSGRQSIKLSNASSGNLVLSVFAKKREYSVIQLTDARNGSAFINFNLQNGSVGSSSGFTGQITDEGNDWYRCSATYNSTSDVLAIRISIAEGSTSTRLENFSGNGSDGLFIWGAQLEQDGFVSSYIPTTGSTATVSTTLNDTSEVWDFDSTDIMLEADPEDEGFWEEGSNLVLNHDYADMGSDLVTNGTFETEVTSSQWLNFGSPTTAERSTTRAYEGTHSYHIVGDSTNDGTQATSTQFAGDYSDGDIVEITAYVYPITASSNEIKTGVANSSRSITSAYTVVTGQWNKVQYQVTITDSSTNNNYITFLIAGSAGEFYLDNVSARIVDPNNRWTLTGSANISDGKMTLSGDGGTSVGYQSMLVQGTTYELTYTISNFSLSSGEAVIKDNDGNNIQNISGDGTFTVIFTHLIANGNLIFRATSGTNSYQVDNVTVREYAVQPKDI